MGSLWTKGAPTNTTKHGSPAVGHAAAALPPAPAQGSASGAEPTAIPEGRAPGSAPFSLVSPSLPSAGSAALSAGPATPSTDMPLRGGGEPRDGGPGTSPAGRSGALIPAEASPAREGNAAPPICTHSLSDHFDGVGACQIHGCSCQDGLSHARASFEAARTNTADATRSPASGAAGKWGRGPAPEASPSPSATTSTPAGRGSSTTAPGAEDPRPAEARPDTYLELLVLLEDALAQVEADEAADRALARLPFTPDTPEKVAWLMRLLFELQEEGARILASAEARVRALEQSIRRLGRCSGAPLLEHLREQLSRVRGRRNARSVRLEQGTLGLRKIRATGGVQITDARAAREHAALTDDPTAPRFGEWVTRYELRAEHYRAIAAERFDATGELMPGCEYVPAAETLYVHSDLRDAKGNRAMKSLAIARVIAGEQIADANGAPRLDTDQEDEG